MSESFRKESLPKKSVAMKILAAYGGGVTNIAEGVEYTAFGREEEVMRFNQTLKMTQQQSGRMEAFVGPYGVGKSFIMALFQSLAVKKGFIVMSADISKNTWFSGTAYEKQGIQLYRELIKNTAIKGKGMNAFDTILSKWYDDLKDKVGGSGNIMDIFAEFDKTTKDYKDLPHYADIRAAIFTRFNEFKDSIDYSKAMDYFLANFTKKTDVQSLGSRDYIREGEWFGVLNTLSHLFVVAGYRGLILLFDQVDYLTNLQKNNRQQNYEAMLTMWNAINEGRTEYLSVCLFAAEKLIDDEHRGTQMYKALDDRLGNATRLDTLPAEEMVGLLKRLKEIHEFAYSWDSKIDDTTIALFVEESLRSSNMTGNCVRPISMGWIKKLNDLQINVEMKDSEYQKIIKQEAVKMDDTSIDDSEETPSDVIFPDD